MALEAKETNQPSFRNYLYGFGAFAFLVTVFMAGFGLSNANWSAAITVLQTNHRQVQEQLSTSREELSQVRSEYAAYRQKQTSAAEFADSSDARHKVAMSTTQAKRPPQTSQNLPAISSVATPATSISGTSQTEMVSIPRGASRSAFGGQVIISFVGSSFEGDPLRNRISANIGAPGYPSISFVKQDVGYATKFSGAAEFEVRISSADTFESSFQVTRITP